MHLAWDVMVGGGTLLALLAVWWARSWIFRRDIPKTKWFLRIAACCGVLSVIVMEAGWVVTEVGRQPWIVRNYMKVEDAATGNTGVWITFVMVVILYAVVGRHDDPGAARDEPALARVGRRAAMTVTCRTGRAVRSRRRRRKRRSRELG